MDLAPQDSHLAQHDDLDGKVGVVANDEADQLEDAAERPVEDERVTTRCSVHDSPGAKVGLPVSVGTR